MSNKPKINMLDPKDADSFRRREAAWMSRKGPRVGDWVQMPGEDFLRRFTHDWDHTIQTTMNEITGLGSFFMSWRGFGDYSGGLQSGIPKSKLVDTMTVAPGVFWFFHHEEARAHNGISIELPCRIYRYEP